MSIPRTKVVPLVGFWQWHNVRPRQPLQRSPVLGTQTRFATHHRGLRSSSSPGDRAPASMSVTYQFGPAGDMPACTLNWYQGTARPAILADGRIPQKGFRNALHRRQGHAALRLRKTPAPAGRVVQWIHSAEAVHPGFPGHHEEWLLACTTGSPTSSPFSYAGLLTITNHLGNVAYRVGRKLEWDPATGHCPQLPRSRTVPGPRTPKGLDAVNPNCPTAAPFGAFPGPPGFVRRRLSGATVKDEKYGPHDRNVLDFWQANSDRPTARHRLHSCGGFTPATRAPSARIPPPAVARTGDLVCRGELPLSIDRAGPGHSSRLRPAIQFLRQRFR